MKYFLSIGSNIDAKKNLVELNDKEKYLARFMKSLDIYLAVLHLAPTF